MQQLKAAYQIQTATRPESSDMQNSSAGDIKYKTLFHLNTSIAQTIIISSVNWTTACHMHTIINNKSRIKFIKYE